MNNSTVLQKKQNVEKALLIYEKIIQRYKERAMQSFYKDLAIQVLVPLAAGALALFFSNIAGILTTLGVGAVNFGEKMRRGDTMITKYWTEKGQLEDRLFALQLENQMCDNDEEKLDKLLGIMSREFEGLRAPKTALAASPAALTN